MQNKYIKKTLMILTIFFIYTHNSLADTNQYTISSEKLTI